MGDQPEHLPGVHAVGLPAPTHRLPVWTWWWGKLHAPSAINRKGWEQFRFEVQSLEPMEPQLPPVQLKGELGWSETRSTEFENA
jgi:hypothetical protein